MKASDKMAVAFFVTLVGIIGLTGVWASEQFAQRRVYIAEACGEVDGRDYAGCVSQAYARWRAAR